jgi:hypothetical protein
MFAPKDGEVSVMVKWKQEACRLALNIEDGALADRLAALLPGLRLFGAGGSAANRSPRNAANSGSFYENLGNLCSRKTVWWGWADSNLQPNDYQPPALSIEQSGAVS